MRTGGREERRRAEGACGGEGGHGVGGGGGGTRLRLVLGLGAVVLELVEVVRDLTRGRRGWVCATTMLMEMKADWRCEALLVDAGVYPEGTNLF